MRIFYYLLLAIIVILGITFAVLNSSVVTVNYYVGQRTMALSLLLAAVFVAGNILGLIVAAGVIIKTKMKNYRLQQKLLLAEKEIENLRAIPLQDKH